MKFLTTLIAGTWFLVISAFGQGSPVPIPLPAQAIVIDNSGYDICLFQPKLLSEKIEVPQYNKLEIGIKLPQGINTAVKRFVHKKNGTQINPFDSSQIDVWAEFVSAVSGKKYRVNGFYYEEFNRKVNYIDKSKSKWQEDSTAFHFRVRFAHGEIGNWNVQTFIELNDTILSSKKFTFSVINGEKKGYVTRGFEGNANDKFLRHESRETFIPIGETVAYAFWNELKPESYSIFKKYLNEISRNGGNLVRLWMNPGGFLFEREKLGDYSRNYSSYFKRKINRQTYAWELDQVMELCDELDLYAMMAVVGSEFDPDQEWGIPPNSWTDNPYKKELSLETPFDFFASDSAQYYVKRRFRYFMARWGYDFRLPFYEIVGEPARSTTERGDELDVIESWLDNISNYVHSEHYVYHLTLTDFANSSSSSKWRKNYWLNTSLDVAGVNDYGINQDTNYKKRWNKANKFREGKIKHMPYQMMEFGAGIFPNLDYATDIALHNAMWSSMFNGSCGPAIPYWWDRIHADGAHHEHIFRAISVYTDNFYLTNGEFTQSKWTDGISYEGIEAYMLTAAEKDTIYGWAHNTDYWWKTMQYKDADVKQLVDSCNGKSLTYPNGKLVDRVDDTQYCDEDRYKSLGVYPEHKQGAFVKIRGLKNRTNYKIVWYSTHGQGGKLTEFNETVKTGFGLFGSTAKVKFPSLTNDSYGYQDFGFIITRVN